jgi:hypothetical protein
MKGSFLLVRELHWQAPERTDSGGAMKLSTLFTTLLVATALGISAPVIAAAPSDSFSARVVNFEQPMGPAPGLLQVRVTRWSTDADRDALTTALMQDGQKGVIDALKKMSEAGVIRTPGIAGYAFKYARRIVTAAGDEQLLMIVDRPIGFAEFRQGWQTVDYPFTIVKMTLNAQGQGTGELMAATKLMANSVTGDIAFEHYNATPALLQAVKRE